MTALIVATFLALHVAFAGGRVQVFRIDGATSAGVRLIEVASVASIASGPLLIATRAVPHALADPLALLCARVSAALFAWGVHVVGRLALTAAFSADTPRRLLTQGPFRFTRNPFYCAYLLGHAVPLLATRSAWALPALCRTHGPIPAAPEKAGSVPRRFRQGVPVNIDIRLINGPDELQAVLQLRRRICVQELGYDVPLAPAGQPLAGEALDLKGHLFGAFEGPRLVGAVRVNDGGAQPGRVGGGFGPYADFYGMRRFGRHPAAGAVLPMAFAVYHREHFLRLQSPLAVVCPRHDHDTAVWFDTRFAGEMQASSLAAVTGTSIA